MARHEEKLAARGEAPVDLLFVGDSITQGWEAFGGETWEKYYGGRNAFNIGFSGDRTEHVLWRLRDGAVDGLAPRVAVVMIGTNNHRVNTAEEIGVGVRAVAAELRERLPETKILLLAIFPREERPGPLRDKIAEANVHAARAAEDPMVTFLDIGGAFLDDDGRLSSGLMPDYLHPNPRGYRVWAQAMEVTLWELLGEEGPPRGFVPLFNGEDLTGWQGLVKDPEQRARMSPEALAEAQAQADEEMRAHWSVDGGVIVFDGGGSHLVTARDYEDVELVVDWKIEAGGDSGIYLRGAPQVQIWDAEQWPVGSGGLYNNEIHPSDPLVRADNPVGEWNRFRIEMVGEAVTVDLNGVRVVDKVALENYWNRDIPIYPSGPIELQSHGSRLWFKNLYVREIPRGEGWSPLFNGRDLSGWQQIGGDSDARWEAAKGELFPAAGRGGWLSTVEQYGDFEIELEFNVPPGGNSGVFVRAPHEGSPSSQGFEIQILDDFADKHAELEDYQYNGSLYAVAGPSRQASLPAGVWQKMRIRAEGPLVSVWLNGHVIVDEDLRNHADKYESMPGLQRERGYLGLQHYGDRVLFRNIRLRTL